MIFWLAVCFGLLSLYLATRIGFFETVVLSFNLLVSVFVGVYATPTLIDLVPSAADFAYGTATTVAALSLISFVCLYGASYVLLTGQFKVTFPKVFDVLISGSIGFGLGVLLVSYLVFVLSIMPFAQGTRLLDETSIEANMSLLCLCCDQVQHVVAAPDTQLQTRDLLGQITERAQAYSPPSVQEADPNQ
jgi:hypothetical protein